MSGTVVKNNHTGPLIVANVEIRPNTASLVDTIKFNRWKDGSNAARIWLKKEIISVETVDADETNQDDSDQTDQSDDEADQTDQSEDESGQNDEPTRDELVERANELGIEFHANTGYKKLKLLVDEAEQA